MKTPLKAFLAALCLFLFLELLARISLTLIEDKALLLEGDALWRHRWLERKKNNDIYAEIDRFDPELGWKTKINLRLDNAFNDKKLSTNKQGFRSDKDFVSKKDPNKRRIIFIGDSFTFGEEVHDHEVYTSLLQSKMPNTEIMNMGVHGYGHDQMLLLLRNQLAKFKPDQIVLGFVYYNIFRNLLSFRDYAKPKFVDIGRALVIKRGHIELPESLLRKEFFRLKLMDLIYSFGLRLQYKIFASKEEKARALTRKILDQMKILAQQNGIKFSILYMPVGSELAKNYRFTKRTDFIKNYCEANELSCFSLSQAFIEAMNEGMQLESQRHWSAREHKLAAEEIVRYFLD